MSVTACIIYVSGGVTYMHINQAAKIYDCSVQDIYRHLKVINSLDRYKDPRIWTVINEDGHRMVNTLVLEDYFRYKPQIKAGIKKLPPYDPALARWNRGEYKVPLLGTGETIIA